MTLSRIGWQCSIRSEPKSINSRVRRRFRTSDVNNWRSASRVRTLRDDCGISSPTETPSAVVESLSAYLDGEIARRELAVTARTLAPQSTPRTNDDDALLAFAAMAEAAWNIASALVALEALNPNAVRNALLPDGSAQGWGMCIQRVGATVCRTGEAKALLFEIDKRSEFLDAEALEPCRVAVLRGDSIVQWVRACADGLQEIDALIAWEADKKTRTGLPGAALSALEEFEGSMPHPQAVLQPRVTGADWWIALVRYSASMDLRPAHQSCGSQTSARSRGRPLGFAGCPAHHRRRDLQSAASGPDPRLAR